MTAGLLWPAGGALSRLQSLHQPEILSNYKHLKRISGSTFSYKNQ